jgi:hypothetical protein
LLKLLEKPVLHKPVVLAPTTPGVTAFIETFKPTIFQSIFHCLYLTMSCF